MNRRRRKGSSTIESALALLMFLIVFFSIGDFAQIFLFHYTLSERARAAARAGAVNGYTNEQMANYVMFGTPESRAGMGTFGLSSTNVSVTRDGNDRVIVSIHNLPYESVSPLLSGDLRNMPIRVVVSSEAP